MGLRPGQFVAGLGAGVGVRAAEQKRIVLLLLLLLLRQRRRLTAAEREASPQGRARPPRGRFVTPRLYCRVSGSIRISLGFYEELESAQERAPGRWPGSGFVLDLQGLAGISWGLG
jgi:hypothetical protein